MRKAKKAFAIVLLLSFIILMFGCAANEESEPKESVPEEKTSSTVENVPAENTPEQSTVNEYDGEMTIQFEFGARTGHYKGELNDDGLPNGDGSFSTENASSEAWTYTGLWDNGHFKRGRTEWDDGSSYDGEFMNDIQNGTGVYISKEGAKYVGEFVDATPFGKGTAYYSDGAYFEGVFSSFNDATGYFCDVDGQQYNAALVDGELLVKSVKDPLSDENQQAGDEDQLIKPVEDFLSDENRQARYAELYISYQYSALKDFLQEYIDAKNPAQSDAVFKILEYVEPVLQYEDQWIVTHDEFDNTYSVKFKNANEISRSNSVDVTVAGTGIDYRVGFVRDGWLFFDGLDISTDGEVAYTAGIKSYETTRNVISGREVKEYCFIGINDETAEQIHAAETVIFRFTNDKSKETYDHQLTQAEKDAIYCGMLLRKNNMELANILSRFNNQ